MNCINCGLFTIASSQPEERPVSIVWEILLPKNSIVCYREISTEEILEATPEYLKPEIEAILHSR
jgi:hypothetical protein